MFSPQIVEELAKQISARYSLVQIASAVSGTGTLIGKYHLRPVEYVYEVLGQTLTDKQQEILRKLVTPPFKVLVRSGHNVGKSFLAACAVNYWFDTYKPGVCLTTAPTNRQVRDILWKEVRTLRAKAKNPLASGGFPGPKICRLETAADHFAQGFMARDADRFQGQHGPAVLIIFDEATAIGPAFYEALQTMLGGDNYGFLAIYNPTNQSSPVFAEEKSSGYHPVVTMSCLDHPNITEQLAGRLPVYPNAIQLGRLIELLNKWGTKIPAEAATPYDVKLGEQWYRLGPVAEARLAGRWPRQAVNSVWSEFVYELMLNRDLPDTGPLQIGCDVARYGDDFTAMHVRKGGVSLHHESHNGWSLDQTVDRLKQLCLQFGNKYKVPIRKVKVAVDDTGLGGGVTDFGRRDGFNFIGVNSSMRIPQFEEEYPNLRSALWFGLAEAALNGNISLKVLAQCCPDTILDIRNQLLAPKYTLDTRGRRVVESKDETKANSLDGRSPDDADGMNLAYLDLQDIEERVSGRVTVPTR